MKDIYTPISPGELLDKLTILNIKMDEISDAEKRKNIAVEQAALQDVVDAEIPQDDIIKKLFAGLQAVNKELWDIEDDIRDCERESDFGEEFVRLARAVYVTNDKRADLKKQINQHLGSRLVEEKSYAAY